jgi:hypothetical protein
MGHPCLTQEAALLCALGIAARVMEAGELERFLRPVPRLAVDPDPTTPEDAARIR